MRAWLRDPLLWFAVAGAALFGGWQAFGHRENRIDLSAATQAAMVSDYAGMAGHQPGEAEKQKLIRREVDDEVLLAEGVRRGLHLSDRAIRERIIERMRMELAPHPAEPGEDDLLAFYAEHAGAYVAEPAISFDQIYFARPPADPARVLAQLRAGRPVAGDDFWMGRQMPRYGESMISGMFGLGFLDAIRKQPVGQWAGPVMSQRGAHFVRVNARYAPAPRAYADVRDLVRQDWITAQANRELESALGKLRQGYDIHVEGQKKG